MFRWIYPASLMAITVSWCAYVCSVKDTGWLDDRRWRAAPIARTVLCVALGQLILYCVQPAMNLIALPFASKPVLLYTIMFSVGMMGYGMYLTFRHTILAGAAGQLVVGGRAANRGVEDVCSVCMVNPKTQLIKPCNHYCVCLGCVGQLNECPICMTHIQNHERIYST